MIGGGRQRQQERQANQHPDGNTRYAYAHTQHTTHRGLGQHSLCRLVNGKASSLPLGDPPSHRDHILVAHPLKILGCQHGSHPTGTVQHDLGLRLGHKLLDFALKSSLKVDKGGRDQQNTLRRTPKKSYKSSTPNKARKMRISLFFF